VIRAYGPVSCGRLTWSCGRGFRPAWGEAAAAAPVNPILADEVQRSVTRLVRHMRDRRDHGWSQRHMSDYIDDDLAPDERERVEDHVSICPHCRRVLRTLRRTLKSLMALPAEPHPSVADGVIERLRREP
jgi:Putative zinc-finger